MFEEVVELKRGFKLAVQPVDDCPITQCLKAVQDYEVEESEFIEQYVKPNMTCLDIGANIGYFTLLMARLVGRGGKVFAFEPDATAYAYLRHNVDLNKEWFQTRFYNLGLHEVNGWAELHCNPANTGDNFVRVVGKDERDPDKTYVPLFRLDDVFPDDYVIHFIKLDTQGTEWPILRGGERILRHWRPALMFEFDSQGLRRMGVDPLEFWSWLEGLGYQIRAARGYTDKSQIIDFTDRNHFLNLIAEHREPIRRYPKSKPQ